MTFLNQLILKAEALTIIIVYFWKETYREKSDEYLGYCLKGAVGIFLSFFCFKDYWRVCGLESGEFPGLVPRRMLSTTISKLCIVRIYKIKVALRGMSLLMRPWEAQSPSPFIRKMRSNGEAKAFSTFTEAAKSHEWGQEALPMKYRNHGVMHSIIWLHFPQAIRTETPFRKQVKFHVAGSPVELI